MNDRRRRLVPAMAGSRRRLSIRWLAAISTMLFGALALVIVVALIYTSTLLRQATTTAIRHAHGVEAASEVEIHLLMYHRLSNLYLLTGEEELAETQRDLEARIDEVMALEKDYIEGAEEQRVYDEAAERLEHYLRERERLESLGLDMEAVSQRAEKPLRATVKRLETLRDLNEAQVARAHARALVIDRRSTLLGACAGVFLVIGLLGTVVGVRRYVVRPTLDLHAAVVGFRSGDRERRANEIGSRESAALAHAFNELADELVRQRQSQVEFLAGVAHDLRNPLGALKLGIHALALEQSEERRLRTLERLDRQGGRLARMVDDLLDATRVEAGQLELDLEDIDARDVVDDIVALYAPTSPDHEIARSSPPEPVVVRADPLRLEQVLSNLLSNAIKFSPPGRRIHVSVEQRDSSAVLAVADQGIGIPSDEIESIFIPFRRRRPDLAPGAGLGLSVVRRIVIAHGGDIEVESAPGEGTTFRVELPLAKTDHPAAA